MRSTLKTNLNRTVFLERRGEGGIVIKRFHSPGALRRLTDGRRAAREFRMLSELHELGLPVPEPIELRKRDGRWEVLLNWIPGARPVEEFLAEERRIPIGAGDLSRALARLLARTWEAGLVHSDLHAGNVLLDEAGELWLIDFQHARLSSRVQVNRRRRELILLAAGTRETCSRRFRARFLIEVLRNLRPDERDAFGSRHALIKDVEEAARLHHRYRVHRREVRWTRESGACTAYQAGPVSGWISRAVPVEEHALLQDLALFEFDRSAELLANGFELLETQRDNERWLVIKSQDEALLREAWYAAVRLRDHGLRAPSPTLFVETPEPRMLLRIEETASNRHETANSTCLQEVMQLLGGLHDRGLALADLTHETFRLDLSPPTFGAPIELVTSNATRRERDRHAVLELLGTNDTTEWHEAYCAEWRGDLTELIELHEELARG